MKEQEIKKDKKTDSHLKWIIQVFIMTFVLSICFSFISTNGVSRLTIIPAIIVLFAVIFVGILFDIIGVAVTVANEEEFHAKATKKAPGAKTALRLIKNAARVANVCADVIGDICGVLSGAISTMISLKLTQSLGMPENIQFVISAMVAAFTVGGKAIGKEIANKNSTQIVYTTAKLISKLKNENK